MRNEASHFIPALGNSSVTDQRLDEDNKSNLEFCLLRSPSSPSTVVSTVSRFLRMWGAKYSCRAWSLRCRGSVHLVSPIFDTWLYCLWSLVCLGRGREDSRDGDKWKCWHLEKTSKCKHACGERLIALYTMARVCPRDFSDGRKISFVRCKLILKQVWC